MPNCPPQTLYPNSPFHLHISSIPYLFYSILLCLLSSVRPINRCCLSFPRAGPKAIACPLEGSKERRDFYLPSLPVHRQLKCLCTTKPLVALSRLWPIACRLWLPVRTAKMLYSIFPSSSSPSSRLCLPPFIHIHSHFPPQYFCPSLALRNKL